MKFISIIVLLIFSNILLQAQTLDEIAKKDIDGAIPLLKNHADSMDLDSVELLGLGDIAEFAKETKKINSAFSAYLIQNKDFRNIFLSADDWIIRPLNDYLNDSLPADSLKIDSLISAIFPNSYMFQNREFKSFLHWIKRFNTAHTQDKVKIIGVTPFTKIPASYFLSTYIYPLDVSAGQQFGKKWTNTEPSDSIVTSDIKVWIETIKSKKLSGEQRFLIERCEADLTHNANAVILESLDQKIPAKTLNRISQYIADQILKNLNEKSIFLSSNTGISITDYHSPLAQDEIPINSIGGFLKDALERKYYALGIDYIDTATLPYVDVASQSLEIKIIPGNVKLKEIKSKRDYLTRETDHKRLQGYKLIYIQPFLKLNTATVTDNENLTVDGMLLLSDLTAIELNHEH